MYARVQVRMSIRKTYRVNIVRRASVQSVLVIPDGDDVVAFVVLLCLEEVLVRRAAVRAMQLADLYALNRQGIVTEQACVCVRCCVVGRGL